MVGNNEAVRTELLQQVNGGVSGGHSGVKSDGQTKVVNRCLECYLRCMTGEQPKQGVKWLSLAEWWYNSNFHTSIHTTPYEAVYGKPPPVHIPYIRGESKVDLVDKTLSEREAVMETLKFHISRAQSRMKSHVDNGRTDRKFDCGDWVFLKLQPHKQLRKCRHPNPEQTSGTLPPCDSSEVFLVEPMAILDRRMAKKGQWNGEVAYKFFGPFKILQRIREVAYKLDLPSTSQIHNVFHVSQLRKCRHPNPEQTSGTLPPCDSSGVFLVELMAILDRRMAKKGQSNGDLCLSAVDKWNN
nr:hypothetical protein [Tanacetum cinerariifolium]GEY72908.1 hypothetical protein [Tanacetum cinerariifolium]